MENIKLYSLVLGLIRDVDNALPCKIIAQRINIKEDTVEEIIDHLTKQNLIQTFPDNLDKPTHERRYFTHKESLKQVRSMVREQMSELSNAGCLYFAYGSNLNPEQFYQSRCPGSNFLMRGELIDYRLHFPRASQKWGGGVAGIKYSEGDSVWGAAFLLSQENWNILDQYENIPASYKRIRLPIRTHFGVFCMESYNAVPTGDFLPSASYLNKIVSGAEFFGLPHNYIRRLKNTPFLGERKK